MSLFVHALNTNYVSESGPGQLPGRILTEGVLGLADLAVSEKGTGQNMSVDVAPGALVLHNPAGHGHTLYSTAIENVPLAAADPLNPRKSLIVAVLDVDFTNPLVNDAEGGWSIIEVPGAAASSPLEPDNSAIQVLAGAGNLYEVLALVDVPANASQITDNEVTNRRPESGLIPDLIPSITEGMQVIKSSYSTSEINTGAKWIDGKDIYKKTVSFGALPNATYKSVSHGISGIDVVTQVTGVAKNTTSGTQIIFPYIGEAANAAERFTFYIASSNVTTYAQSNLSAWNQAYFTIYYTKA